MSIQVFIHKALPLFLIWKIEHFLSCGISDYYSEVNNPDSKINILTLDISAKDTIRVLK